MKYVRHITSVLVIVLIAVLAATLHLGMPGWLMGVTAIILATIATTAAVRIHLRVLR